jgi:hypothetical protein
MAKAAAILQKGVKTPMRRGQFVGCRNLTPQSAFARLRIAARSAKPA